MQKPLISLSVLFALTGCAGGIQSDGSSPSLSYTVPRHYQMVYLRAQNQAEQCLRGEGHMVVRVNIDPTAQSGVVSVQDPISGTEVARTELKAVDVRHTEVKHTVWGRHPWDIDALNAMRQSVRMDISTCFAYR